MLVVTFVVVVLLLPPMGLGFRSLTVLVRHSKRPRSSIVTFFGSKQVDPKDILSPTVLTTIEGILQNRSAARWQGDYITADALKEELHALPLPEGWILTLEDLPRSQGGTSTWGLLVVPPPLPVSSSANPDDDCPEGPTVLQLAHAALGFAVSCSQQTLTMTQKEKELEGLVQQAKQKLLEWKSIQNDDDNEYSGSSSARLGWNEVETTMRGRKAADAAFWFALAGVTDQDVMELLADVCRKELERFGTNPSCRIKDITQMMDRFAACGGLQHHAGLERVAKDCLTEKLVANVDDASPAVLTENLLDLHSDRCLLMLWKFAARQKKQQSFLQSAKIHWEKRRQAEGKYDEPSDHMTTTSMVLHEEDTSPLDWSKCFDDPSLPLVIDIGCGMGISLLGLASSAVDTSSTRNDDVLLSLSSESNFLGIDLSSLAIGYAQGVSKRCGLKGRLHYVVDSAESMLAHIADTYPGNVSLALIQFPTPYRLPMNTTTGGNSQLPISAHEGFMVSPSLLRHIRRVLFQQPQHGTLLLQSNCEDVAVWMLHAARDVGFQPIPMRSFRTSGDMEGGLLEEDLNHLPQRTRHWVERNGERAIGSSWSNVPLLPRRASTETEVACRLNKTPIHRCLVRPVAVV